MNEYALNERIMKVLENNDCILQDIHGVTDFKMQIASLGNV